ncbi:hypothetical protein [Croceicoccus sp. BE223]|uniref:hypothetical protein n=1 Tax=Croceicoccus sp. BE223 TaxID=2817716 RepID=UPI0028642A18|nr:hypothetical protein [Croceicoccus sp. BE223]MDR7103351.1 hypothetical protein [Croceicoccus sp. BE223]
MPRFLIQVLGVALFLSGGLWTLQGLGLVMWPAESFMLDQKQWAAYGVIAAAAGVLLLWIAQRKMR